MRGREGREEGEKKGEKTEKEGSREENDFLRINRFCRSLPRLPLSNAYLFHSFPPLAHSPIPLLATPSHTGEFSNFPSNQSSSYFVY
jgi:hypothetical protein